MSHFTVLVIGEDVERQLQPFHEFECTGTDDEFVKDVDLTHEVLAQMERSEEEDKLTDALGYFGLEDRVVDSEEKVDRAGKHKFGYAVLSDGKLIKAIDRTNPNKKWDWWVVGGRWTGFFKLKPGRSGDVGRPGLMTERAKPGYADQAVKAAIDFEGMRDEKGEDARKLFRQVHAIVAGREIPNWDAIREKHGAGGIKAAQAEYAANPVVMDIRADPEFVFLRKLEDFAVPEDEHVRRARESAISTFAVLMDGKWYERGRMGWWGMVSDEKDTREWNAQFSKLLDSVSDDTLLTVVDCHI